MIIYTYIVICRLPENFILAKVSIVKAVPLKTILYQAYSWLMGLLVYWRQSSVQMVCLWHFGRKPTNNKRKFYTIKSSHVVVAGVLLQFMPTILLQ